MNLQIKQILIVTVVSVLGILAFSGCGAAGAGSKSSLETEILGAIQKAYPPDQKPGQTSNYELFKFEPREKKPEGASDAWCVEFLFTNKVGEKSERWIGNGDVVKKDGNYSFSTLSGGCDLSEEEKKKLWDLKTKS